MVQIVAAQNAVRSSFVSANNRLKLAGSNFVTGNRYLVLWTANHETDENSRASVDLFFNGVSDDAALNSFDVAGRRPSGMQATEGFHVWTGVSGHDIDLNLDNIQGTGHNALDEQIMAINLDDGLVENQDWFHDVNKVRDFPDLVAFGSEAEPAEITFTPDGTSNYVVFGHMAFVKTVAFEKEERWRLRDRTNGVTLADGGAGNHQHTTHLGGQSMRLMGVMQTPAAVPTTVATEYRGSSSADAQDKDVAQLFILRLDAFEKNAFRLADVNAEPAFLDSAETWTTFNYTPDVAGSVVLLADYKANADPDVASGIVGTILYDGPIVSSLGSRDANRVLNSGPSGGFGEPDIFVGPSLTTLLTGQSGVAEVIGKTIADGILSELVLRRMALVVFGTQLGPFPAGDAATPSLIGSPSLTKETEHASKAREKMLEQFKSGETS